MNAIRLTALLASCVLLQACVTTTELREIPVSDDDAAIANLNLGTEYLRQGRPDAALESLQRALTLNPRLADAHSTIALAHDQLGNTDLAEQHYRRATQIDSNNAAAQNSYAVFLCRQNRWEDAERLFKRAANNSNYATREAALTNAGVCARNAGDTEAAESYFREALEIDPTYPDALANMLELTYQNESYMQARAFMQRSLAARPADARLLWFCFQIEQELDDSAAAERCATQLSNDFPASAELAQIREMERNAGR